MGQLFALLVPTVAAAESAIGLIIFVITFRVRGTIAVEFINSIQELNMTPVELPKHKAFLVPIRSTVLVDVSDVRCNIYCYRNFLLRF
jgi:hypothetical protein